MYLLAFSRLVLNKMAEGIGAPTCAINGSFWLALKMAFCSDGTKTPLAISGFCERLLVHGLETLRMLYALGHAIYRSALFQRDSKGNTMYDIVKEFENKGIDIGIQKNAADNLDTLSQLLISTLEQRFPSFPDNLKTAIKHESDIKRIGSLLVSAGTTTSPEEFARQLSV